MIKNQILFLDLDGTIKSCISAIANHGIVHNIDMNWQGESYIEGRFYSFIERPHLKEFLDSLKTQGWTINLATMGCRSYAIKCLEAMGVREYFKTLVCGIELRKPDLCTKFTIVDDRPDLLEWKADQISHCYVAAEINKILIPTFLGGYDDELLKLSNKLAVLAKSL